MMITVYPCLLENCRIHWRGCTVFGEETSVMRKGCAFDTDFRVTPLRELDAQKPPKLRRSEQTDTPGKFAVFVLFSL